MAGKVKTVQYGCGPIGCSVVKYAQQTGGIEFVGAIDSSLALAAKDLGEVSGTGRLGILISADAEGVLTKSGAEVVFLTTTSSLKDIYPQIEKCAAAKLNVISTCEELSFPFRKDPKLSADIDKVARANGITVLGTGVNPGFLMDAWPLFMTGICQEVRHVKSIRVQDASSRRGPFQKKIGAGCTLDKFKKLVAAGTLKHVGLPESIAMIADGLGWELDDITETIEPVIAKASVKTSFVNVQPGQASGVRQVGKGVSAGKELIYLEFLAAVGAPESYDAVYITGTPNLEVVIKGSAHGDVATAAMTVNCTRRVIDAPPGLVTMKDLPVVSAQGY